MDFFRVKLFRTGRMDDWDTGYFRIEVFRTGIVDISELSYLGLG